MVTVSEKSQDAVLKSFSEGRFYLQIPASNKTRLILEEYAAIDRTSGQKAFSGQTLQAEGVPVIRVHAKYSDDSSGTLHILLLRNGSIIQNLTKTIPFTLDYEDFENTNSGKSYYRVIAYSEESPTRLLTNPIFVEHA